MKPVKNFEFLVLIEKDEDDMLIASVSNLKGCHTQAKTMPELLKRIQEAIKVCLKSEKIAPKPLRFVGIQEIKVAV